MFLIRNRTKSMSHDISMSPLAVKNLIATLYLPLILRIHSTLNEKVAHMILKQVIYIYMYHISGLSNEVRSFRYAEALS